MNKSGFKYFHVRKKFRKIFHHEIIVLFLACWFIIAYNNSWFFQSVSINNDGSVPNNSAMLDVKSIIHIEANSNYTVIYFNNRPKLTASKILKDFEDLLSADIFFRAHHSHLINLNYIKRYIKGDDGQIELQSGNYVDVPRRKEEVFLKAIGS